MLKKILLVAVVTALMCGVSHGAVGLVHHYHFEDGTADDQVGTLDGTLMGTASISGGSLILDGGGWMELNAAELALSTYSELSMEAWYVALPNPGWSMLAAVGNTIEGWKGVDYFFMTAHREDDKSRAAISCGDYASPWADESGADGPEYNDSLVHHMVATVTADTITLYIDGNMTGQSALVGDNILANIDDVYAYVGKSVYADPLWIAEVLEFSIYNVALPECVVQFSNAAGPYVPEPTTIALLGLGSLVLLRRRK